MEKFLDMIKKKRYTLLASDSLFQYPVNRESVLFTENGKRQEIFLLPDLCSGTIPAPDVQAQHQ